MKVTGFLSTPTISTIFCNKPSHQKLSKRYYGLFQISKKINTVAFELNLPPGLKIHPVFHISLLKPHIGDPPTTVTMLPQAFIDNKLVVKPLAIWTNNRN